MNVFEILEIKHTKDFFLVKKAYMCKVMQHRMTNPNVPLPSRVQEAWAEVNSQEKLFAYYSTCVAEDTPNKKPRFLEIPIYDTTDDTIDVFVPVGFVGRSKNKNWTEHLIAELPKLITESHETFASTIDCGYYAQIITNLSNHQQCVGVTAEDAENFINYHSHYHPFLMVQISISFNDLIDFPRPDKPYTSHLLNKQEGEDEYFSLKPNTKISTNNILSIYAINNYLNSRRFDEQIDDYWPKKFLFKPNMMQPEKIEQHKPESSTLQEFAHKEMERLEQNWFSAAKRDALKKAVSTNDETKIQEALTIRRFPWTDFFFGKTKVPTTSETNSKNFEKNSLFN